MHQPQSPRRPAAADLPPEPDCSQPVKLEGYLLKLGEKGLIKDWKKRWFVLDEARGGGRISYLTAPLAEGGSQQGTIELSQVQEVQPASDNAAVPPANGAFYWRFLVHVPGRAYQLKAASEADGRRWLRAIQSAAARARPAVPPHPLEVQLRDADEQLRGALAQLHLLQDAHLQLQETHTRATRQHQDDLAAAQQAADHLRADQTQFQTDLKSLSAAHEQLQAQHTLSLDQLQQSEQRETQLRTQLAEQERQAFEARNQLEQELTQLRLRLTETETQCKTSSDLAQKRLVETETLRKNLVDDIAVARKTLADSEEQAKRMHQADDERVRQAEAEAAMFRTQLAAEQLARQTVETEASTRQSSLVETSRALEQARQREVEREKVHQQAQQVADSHIQRLEVEQTRLQHELEARDRQVAERDLQLQALQTLVADKEALRKGLADECLSVKKALAAMEEQAKRARETSDARAGQLESELAALRTQLAAEQDARHSAENEARMRQATLAETRQALELAHKREAVKETEWHAAQKETVTRLEQLETKYRSLQQELQTRDRLAAERDQQLQAALAEQRTSTASASARADSLQSDLAAAHIRIASQESAQRQAAAKADQLSSVLQTQEREFAEDRQKLRAELETERQQRSALELQLKQQQAETERLVAVSRAQLGQQEKELLTQLQQQQEQLAIRQRQAEEQARRVQRTEELLQAEVAEHTQLRTRWTAEHARVEELQVRLEQQHALVEQHQLRVEQLQTHLADEQQQLGHARTLVSTQDTRLSELQHQHDQLQARVMALQVQLTHALAAHERLETQLRLADQQRLEEAQARGSHEEHSQKLAVALARVEALSQQTSSSETALRQRLNAALQRLEELEAQAEQLRSEAAEREARLRLEHEQTSARELATLERVRALEQQLQQHREQQPAPPAEEVPQEVAAVPEEVRSLRLQLFDADQSTSSLRARVHELEQQMQAARTLEAPLSANGAGKKESSEEEVLALEERAMRLADELRTAREQATVLESRLNAALMTIKELNNDLVQKDNKLRELAEAVRQTRPPAGAQQREDELARLRRANAAHQAQNAFLEQQLAHAAAELTGTQRGAAESSAALQRDLNDLRAAYVALRRALFRSAPPEAPVRLLAAENEQLDSLLFSATALALKLNFLLSGREVDWDIGSLRERARAANIEPQKYNSWLHQNVRFVPPAAKH